MDEYIKDIILDDCDDRVLLKQLERLEKDIAFGKQYLEGKMKYCGECDDFYLTQSFIQDSTIEHRSEKIVQWDHFGDPAMTDPEHDVHVIYELCPKGHKRTIKEFR